MAPEESRAARADRLRPLVAARVAAFGVAAFARAAEISDSAVRAFLRGQTPIAATLDAYEEILEQPDNAPPSLPDWRLPRSGGASPPLARREGDDTYNASHDPDPARARRRR